MNSLKLIYTVALHSLCVDTVEVASHSILYSIVSRSRVRCACAWAGRSEEMRDETTVEKEERAE